MPVHAPRICQCGNTVASGGVCPCARKRKARADANRPSARQRGYDSQWQREAKAFLKMHPRCACGCGRVADMVDHIVPHRGDMRLFWDQSNWQALASSPCHARTKQAAEHRSAWAVNAAPPGGGLRLSETLKGPAGVHRAINSKIEASGRG